MIIDKLDPKHEYYRELLLKNIKGQAKKEFEKLYKSNKFDYAYKLFILQNMIHGVDIQPIAVEISRLRAFLSLIVEEEKNEKQNNLGIKPLPNLEFNFIAANSLMSLENKKQEQEDFDSYLSKSYIEIMRNIAEDYFNADSLENKEKVKKKFNTVQIRIKENKFIDKEIKNKLLSWNPFENKSADFFDSVIQFGIKDFDIVIGNPPYVRHEAIKDQKPELEKAFSIFSSTADLYTYFFELGFRVAKNGGILALITSNKFTRAGYGANLRAFLLDKRILQFIDLNGIKVFESATVDTSIILAQNATPSKAHQIAYDKPKSLDFSLSQIPQSTLSKDGFIFGDSAMLNLKAKIEKIGTPLKEWDISIYRGVLTGYNEAFIITSATKNAILASCKTSEEKERTQGIIKPILRGRDIKRYGYKWADLWLIGTHNGYTRDGEKIPPIDIEQLPAVKAFMDNIAQNAPKGKGKGFYKRDDKGITPYNLRNCAYYEDFEREKIVYQTLARTGNAFTFDNKGFYLPNSAYIIVGENLKYLLGLLNSKIMLWYLDINFAKLDETGWSWIRESVEKLPIPQITADNKAQKALADKITQKVEEILRLKGKDSSASPQNDKEKGKNDKEKPKNDKDISRIESEINELIYQLYDLSNDEIKIIENRNNEL